MAQRPVRHRRGPEPGSCRYLVQGSVHEAIFCLLMVRDGFMAGSANIETLDPRAEGFPILRQTQEARLETVMSNSFGFGGTNATLVFGRV